MYKVLRMFRDLKDNNHVYHVGDKYPHDGIMEVSEKRLLELSTDANRRHVPLIAKVEDEPVQIEPIEAKEEPVENRAEVAHEEPVEGFMNPPEEPEEKPEEPKEEAPKPKKKRGRPRNDAQ